MRIKPMSWAKRDRFLEAVAAERRYLALFAVLAKAGLRPGEALALRPDDVDLPARQLHVERAVSLGQIKGTKTHETRVVDLSPNLARIVAQHLVWLKEEVLRCGWGEPTWLFPSEANTPLDHGRVEKVFHRARTRAKLPHFRVYDLRHTFASLLLAGSAPITYVSAQLGHANPTTTLRHYARWIPSQGQRWIDVLDGTGADRVTRLAQWDAEGASRRAEGAASAANLEPKSGTKRPAARDATFNLAETFGSPGRTRTCDLVINSHPLYQLSYRGTTNNPITLPGGHSPATGGDGRATRGGAPASRASR